MARTLQEKAEYRQSYRELERERNFARVVALWPKIIRFAHNLSGCGGRNEWEKGYDQAVADIKSNLSELLKKAESPVTTILPQRFLTEADLSAAFGCSWDGDNYSREEIVRQLNARISKGPLEAERKG
jgi:hypothetical protein